MEETLGFPLLVGLAMHSLSFFADSAHAAVLVRSPALAQQPSMAVSSSAHAWMCVALRGFTFNCTNNSDLRGS